jgi:hypothetical protein
MRELAEIERRRRAYLRNRPRVPLDGRTLILVDDGRATGASVRAAPRGRRPHPRADENRIARQLVTGFADLDARPSETCPTAAVGQDPIPQVDWPTLNTTRKMPHHGTGAGWFRQGSKQFDVRFQHIKAMALTTEA